MREVDADPAACPRPAPLQGSLVLVTGGARRVGAAIARELAAAGAQVGVHWHRSREDAERLCAELPGAFPLQADLRERAQIARLFEEARGRSATGRVDFLVNNASVFTRAPVAPQPDGDDAAWEALWEETLAVNLSAPLRCTRAALRCGVRGVVNLLDIAAWQPWRGFAAYGAARAGLLQLTRVLAKELAPAVRVNAVAPGTVLFAEHEDEAVRARVRARIPLQQEGQPGDVARAVRFLLSEPFLTGACLPVDGGQGL